MRSLSAPRLHDVASLKRNRSCEVAVLVDVAYSSSSAYTRHESILVRVETVFVQLIVNGISLYSLSSEVAHVG